MIPSKDVLGSEVAWLARTRLRFQDSGLVELTTLRIAGLWGLWGFLVFTGFKFWLKEFLGFIGLGRKSWDNKPHATLAYLFMTPIMFGEC